MPPPFLFLRYQSGTPAVFRYDGSTPTQIGNTFGTGIGVIDAHMGKNRVVQFQNDLYALQNLGVYKLQGDGTTWNFTGGLAFTNPSAGTSIQQRTGLFPITINGETYLIGAYQDTGNNVRVVTMDAATNTWSDTATSITFSPNTSTRGGFLTTIVFQNKFFYTSRNLSGAGTVVAHSYNPALTTSQTYSHPFPPLASNMQDICIHNGRLFIGYITNTGGIGQFHLAEFNGTQWVGLGQVIADSVGSLDATQTRLSLMSDGTNLYYVYLANATNWGFRIVEISDVDSLPGTAIGATVVPSAIRPSGDGGTGFSDIDARLIHVPDTQTNPGSPDHYFYFTQSATSGTLRQMYQWNGNASLMTAVGPAGGDVEHAIPTASAAGGERIFSAVSADNDILITNRETVSGGIKCTFRAYSPGGTSSGTVRFWISLEGEPVSTLAALTTPVTGSGASIFDNLILNVTADGTTDYTVVVPAAANGFTNLDQVDLVPEFF